MIRAEVAQARDQAHDRLAALYEAHAPAALRLAYLIAGNSAEAEDLVHDAIVRMAGRFEDLRDEAAFPAYLRRAIVNLAASGARRRRIEREWRSRQSEVIVLPHDPGRRDEIWRALVRLPVRQRAALILRFYEDLSEAQTAEALRCRPGTVKSLVARGLDAMRKQVTP